MLNHPCSSWFIFILLELFYFSEVPLSGFPCTWQNVKKKDFLNVLLAFFLRQLGLVVTILKLPFEKLYAHNSKDEQKQRRNHQDIGNVLHREPHATKHSLKKKHNNNEN